MTQIRANVSDYPRNRRSFDFYDVRVYGPLNYPYLVDRASPADRRPNCWFDTETFEVFVFDSNFRRAMIECPDISEELFSSVTDTSGEYHYMDLGRVILILARGFDITFAYIRGSEVSLDRLVQL